MGHPSTSSVFGRPTLKVLVLWVRSTVVGTFLAIGHFQVLGALLAVILVVGLAPRVGAVAHTCRSPTSAPGDGHAHRRSSWAGSRFAASSGLGRWYSGSEAARSSRYLYLGAAFTLPILAVAAQAIARRWRFLTPLVLVFLIPIPFNLAAFEPVVFGKGYMEQREFVLTTAVRMPFATDVPKTLQPIPDPYASDKVNMAFLLTAKANGDLQPSTVELTPFVVNEFRVRLGVYQHTAEELPKSCETVTGRLEISPAEGTTSFIPAPVQIATRDGSRQTGPSVTFDPAAAGNLLTAVLPDLDLVVSPPPGATSFKFCET